ncbi:MAG: 23S rRNA (uracil(1939)-C(5))-methyltransferase RlmD [Christensenellaceae bacterium]|nr:23S rRNA (uracil(1939)-C(5))-methyltransferase RlmD [Christensenellaceae bacterium]
MLKKNEIYEIEITDLTVEGLGIGRVDGMAVFVSNMLPGEKGETKIIKVAKNYAIGRCESISEVSPQREVPPCPVFKACGGCTLQHLSYIGQLEAKHRHVENCIRKLAGIDTPVNFPLPCKHPLRYRNKTAFPVMRDYKGRLQIGCYQNHTHTVVDAGSCLLQSEAADKVIELVRQWMEKYNVSAYSEFTGEGLVRHVVVRTTVDGDMMVGLVINGDDIPEKMQLIRGLRLNLPEIMSIVLNENRSRGNVILGEKTWPIFGGDRIRERISTLEYDISLNSFLQVNHDQTELLYTQVLKFARLLPNQTAVDLYCGAGTITLQAARVAGKVYGVEIVPQAIEDAKRNAQLNGMENVRFVLGDCKEGFAQVKAEAGDIHTVIVDPPRKGLEPSVIEDIADAAPGRIVYVSCDPATLGRDLRAFCKRGYEVTQIQPVDMFPQTMHIETVVALERKA